MQHYKKQISLILLAFLSIIIISCKPECLSSKSSSPLAKFSDILKRDYPDWRVLTLSEMDSVTIAYFKKEHPDQSPGLVMGDFDGNGLIDIALLLNEISSVDKIASKSRMVFTIYMQIDKAKYNQFPISDEVDYFGDKFILIVPKGKIIAEIEDVKTSVYLKFESLQYVHYEAASRVYYWSGKGFRYYQTSD